MPGREKFHQIILFFIIFYDGNCVNEGLLLQTLALKMEKLEKSLQESEINDNKFHCLRTYDSAAEGQQAQTSSDYTDFYHFVRLLFVQDGVS